MDRRRFTLSLATLAAASTVTGCGSDGKVRRVERLAGGSPFKGVNGLAFDARGTLYAGTVMGQSILSVDPATGATAQVVGPAASAGAPSGMADDIAFAPNGDMFWTSLLLGQLQVRRAGGALATLNTTLPGINSIAFHPDGRLFVTQCFLADALWRVDPASGAAVRIAQDLDTAPAGVGPAGLNGFQFGADGRLYGPLWNKGEVVAIDVDATPVTVTTVASGFGTPGAVNLDSRGNIWVVDVARGELVRIDRATRAKTVVAGAPAIRPGLDNLAIDAQDRVYVSNASDNSIQVYEGHAPATGLGGTVRTVVSSTLSTPAGLALVRASTGDALYLADFFALRQIDPVTGAVTDLGRPVASVLPYPTSITANAASLVTSSWFAGTVQVLDRASRSIRFLQNGFEAPHDAIQLPDGAIVVAELGAGRLTRVAPGGGARSALASGLGAPAGLAYDGTRFFVGEVAAGRISAVDATTGARTTVATDLSRPEGIALDPRGRLVVAETGRRRIVALDAGSGAIVDELGTDLPIGVTSAAGPPTYIPTGVAVGSDGTVYFSADVDAAVYRIVER